ncbi:MAG: NEW3 domain-containing protein, partial [archaeon GB-1867-035]|nr:NEW3 domain-containing protein [Candidatus Culexmicrobium profundum]
RVSVRVSPPVDVKFGVYGFVVNVASVDGVINESFKLSVRIVGKPEIHIRLLETPTLSLTAVAGESLKLTVEVSNYGTLNVTDVYLEVKVPSIDWDYVVKPSKISVIKPGESANFTLTLTLSSIIIPEDYMIDLAAHSKQASSNSLNLRVTVTKPTEWGYLIVGGVVVLVVLLFVFFRLKGRR